MGFSDVNFLAVLVAAVVSMAVGYLWYGPFFGKEWARLMGFDMNDPAKKEEMQKGMKPAMIGTFISFLVMGVVLASLASGATVSQGLNNGFWVWLGFVATTLLINGLWARKKPRLIAIDAGHLLAVLLVMGAIIAVWK